MNGWFFVWMYSTYGLQYCLNVGCGHHRFDALFVDCFELINLTDGWCSSVEWSKSSGSRCRKGATVVIANLPAASCGYSLPDGICR